MKEMTLVSFQNRTSIENAVRTVSEKIIKSGSDFAGWKSLSEDELFSRLVACILGSRVRFEIADAYVRRLKNENLLNPNRIAKKPKISEKRIRNILMNATELTYPVKGRIGYPFPNTRSRFIVATSVNIYENSATSLREILEDSYDPYSTRNKLVRMCTGVGLKQASLFLRNIHYTENLAILDSHVLDFMAVSGMIEEEHSRMGVNQYLSLEQKLIKYSKSIHIPLPYLDLSIWIVMRVLRRDIKWAS